MIKHRMSALPQVISTASAASYTMLSLALTHIPFSSAAYGKHH